MKIKAQVGPGKTALITGGSSGIGYALAQLLVQQGNNVILLARRKELLELRVGELKAQAISPDQSILGLQTDVADWDQVQIISRQVIVDGRLPDMIINSAGIVEPGYIQDLRIEQFHEMMDINFHGTVHVIKAFLPEMMKRKSGFIVNISSGGGYAGVFGYTGYSASKFAVRGFSDALRYELAPYQIGVSIVYPPDTETPQLEYDNLHKPLETKAISGNAGKMTAEAVAKEIVMSARRGKDVILPGFESKILYFLSTNFGGKVIEWVSKLILHRVNNGGNNIEKQSGMRGGNTER